MDAPKSFTIQPIVQEITQATATLALSFSRTRLKIITLQHNISTFTISGIEKGAMYCIAFVQDATGGRTVAKPANFLFESSVDLQPNKETLIFGFAVSDSKIVEVSSSGKFVAKGYASETELLNNQSEQIEGFVYRISNSDEDIWVEKLSTSTGSRDDYKGWQIHRRTVTVVGDNTTITKSAFEYNRTIKKVNIEIDTPPASVLIFDVLVAGASIFTSKPTIQVGQTISTDVDITTTSWPAFKKLEIQIPDTGATCIVSVDNVHDGVAQSLPLPQLVAPGIDSISITSPTSVTVNISDNNTSPNEVNTEVEYDTVNTFDNNPQTATINQDGTSVLIGSLTTGQEYFFRATAKGDNINTSDSPYSNTMSATPATVSGISEAGVDVNTINETLGDSSISVSHTLVAGNNRIVLAAFVCTGYLPSVTATYGGQAMTQVNAVGIDGEMFVYLFAIKEASLPANGARDCVCSHQAWASTNKFLYVKQLDNCHQTEVLVENTNSSSVAVTELANTLTPSIAGSYIFSAFITANGAATNITEGNGQTQLFNGQVKADGSGGRASIAKLENASASAKTLTSTIAGTADKALRAACSIAPAA